MSLRACLRVSRFLTRSPISDANSNCLRSWLEQDTSCPKCRKSLQDEKDQQAASRQAQPADAQTAAGAVQPAAQPGDGTQAPLPQPQPGVQAPRLVQRNLFQFNGSRYISWLPSFSLQVTNGTNVVLPGLLRSRTTLEPERLNEMVSQLKHAVCFFFIFIGHIYV